MRGPKCDSVLYNNHIARERYIRRRNKILYGRVTSSAKWNVCFSGREDPTSHYIEIIIVAKRQHRYRYITRVPKPAPSWQGVGETLSFTAA